MNLNKVFLIGRVTANPELRTTPSGQSVTTFGLATNRVWTDKNNQRQEETEFHNVVVWGRQAEIASQYMTKGGLVCVEGRLRTRSWQDKQGASRKSTEIICERFQLGPRAANSGAPAGEWRGAKGDASAGAPGQAPAEELPVIDLEELAKEEPKEETKPEDIPF